MTLLATLLVLAACGGGNHTAVHRCALSLGQTPSPQTGEHPVAVTTSCALTETPQVEIFGLHGRRLPFTYVQEGGPKGSHVLLLDKYRCDVRHRDLGHDVKVDGTELEIGRSLLDWCPSEPVSTIVRIYLGGRHPQPTWRGVLHDISDGRFDKVWTCGTLRTAIAHLPVDSPNSSLVRRELARATAPACDAALAGISSGTPRFAVGEALGKASTGGPRCPVWRWPPESGSVDGARICFANRRATLVQTALHG
jgi:hypothetical protein